MKMMGLQAKKVVRKRRTTNSEHSFPRYPNLVEFLVVQRPDQVWVADITYIRLKHGFVYLAVIMDVFTRAIRGWHLDRSLDQNLTLTALRKALETHAQKFITRIKVCSMRLPTTPTCSNSTVFRSAWRKSVNLPKTDMLNGSCAPSRKRRSIYLTTRIIMMLTNRSGGFWKRFTCTNVYIHLSAT